MTNNQSEQALLFRQLHDGRQILALPNAWDVASACLIEVAGAKAIATTSAGVAWSLGAADGDQLDRDRALDLIARIVAAVDVPVTADIESGYAEDPDGVAETSRRVLAAGAVGVNLEDGRFLSGPVEKQAQRIAAARRAADAVGVPMFLNARIDIYLRQFGDPADRLTATVERASAYLAAGGDGIFVPGVVDPETIAALVEAVPGPLNVLAGPGAPTVDELAKLGVARVSLGAGVASAAYALARRSAEELFATGSYSTLADAVDYGELNALMGGRS